MKHGEGNGVVAFGGWSGSAHKAVYVLAHGRCRVEGCAGHLAIAAQSTSMLSCADGLIRLHLYTFVSHIPHTILHTTPITKVSFPMAILSGYYILLEIFPCACILFYHRRLPPRVGHDRSYVDDMAKHCSLFFLASMLGVCTVGGVRALWFCLLLSCACTNMGMSFGMFIGFVTRA